MVVPTISSIAIRIDTPMIAAAAAIENPIDKPPPYSEISRASIPSKLFSIYNKKQVNKYFYLDG